MLSVVVPVYNDWLRFVHTLHGLFWQRCSEPFEIIVVNDGGNRDFQSAIEKFKVLNPALPVQYHYLEPECKEFRAAAARNVGMRAAQGSRIAFLDCDTVPAFGCLEAHLGAPEAVLIGLRRRVAQAAVEMAAAIPFDLRWYEMNVWTDDERVVQKVFRDAYQALPGGKNKHIIFWSCNLSVPIQPLLDIGGFDERYVGWGGEDEDLGIRLLKYGLEFRRTNALVYHLDHAPRTPRSASELLKITASQDIVRNGGPLQKIKPCYL